VGIARGRSYASVLAIPRRKMSLCEALHGRRPWPDLKLHGSSWGAHQRGEGEGGERGEQWGAAGGGARPGLCGLLFVSYSLPALPLLCVLWLAVREGEEKEEERRGKTKRKEKKRKEKKRKKYEKKFKLENFQKKR
jgi:hypothetical protein